MDLGERGGACWWGRVGAGVEAEVVGAGRRRVRRAWMEGRRVKGEGGRGRDGGRLGGGLEGEEEEGGWGED